ncbi:MAG: carbohydrate binding domain-containing protein [Candidatus Poribacteria bacterium]|nr:carbohydrate binding domain-containing protein [Candidatus Poribacteria bacterium]
MRTTRIRNVLAVLMATFISVVTAYAADDIVNLVENGDFENGGYAPFVSYGPVTLALTKQKADAHTGSDALTADIPGPGANFWDAGIQYNRQPDVIFEKGVEYTWAFFMKADPPVRINIKPELGVDPWVAYGERQVDVTDEYQEFVTTWTAGVAVVPASLTLHVQFGKSTLYMDDVRWYEGEYVPFDDTGAQAVEPEGKAATTWGSLKAR